MKQGTNDQGFAFSLAEQVLTHKQQINAAMSEIARIQTAIIARQESISQAQATIPATPDRQQERNNIMADIDLGKAKETALREIDERIAKEHTATQVAQKKVAQSMADAQATLDGLFNKLAIAQEALKKIEGNTTEVARRYFMGMAEIAAAQFLNHALAMKELYIKLAGLNISIQKYGGKDVMVHGKTNIYIPRFNLPQFEGVGSLPSNDRTTYLDGYFLIFGDYFIDASKKEEARFEALLQGQGETHGH